MGAHRLHVIDLDGAATGEPGNLDIIKQIASAILIPVQLGGGVRRFEAVQESLKAGVERVILGTAAVEDPALVKETCHRFASAIVVSIDARQGQIATHGWRQETGLTAIEFARTMVGLGVGRFIYTDINRDGTLTEPNFTAIAELIEAIRLPVVAAGGIATLNHLQMLKKLGAEGAIIGKALYTGDIDLKKALAAVG
jgi:phosphoribosylformimino-5-aminoimidazole carboxamide ribotide isomerase